MGVYTDSDAQLTERRDAVILGAGVSGMTAAYRLRDRDIVVLEAEDRVGGRTLSGGDDRAWYNLGAQIVSSRRMADFCRELELDLVSVRTADFGFVIDGRFSRGPTPTALLNHLHLPLAQKLDFGFSSVRLGRKLHSLANLDADALDVLDKKSLLDVIGRVSPSTMRIWNACCENAAGIPPDAISGVIGLAYALGAYLDPKSKQDIYGVRGGSQQVAKAVAARLDSGAIRLGVHARSVDSLGDSVRVTYETADGRVSDVVADHCICALPAHAVLRTVNGLSPSKRTALQRLLPYSTLISVAWPVADNRTAPWDGVFFAPVSGSERFGLITNYGYLAKQRDPGKGGYLNTFAAGATSARFGEVDDAELLDMHYAELLRVFPAAGALLDRNGGVVQRWQDAGLPAMRPGYLSDRRTLREPVGQIHFCGDYTAEPGLTGANGSGYYAAEAVLRQTRAAPAARA